MRINRQITVVIIMSMGLLLFFSIIFTYYSMNNLKNEEIKRIKQTLIEERKHHLRDVVQNAYSVLETARFYEPAQAAISNMRFGEDDQNYFFVIDQNGMFWVNPAQPESVGTVYLDLTDANGQRYIEEIISNANSAESAFVQYQAHKSGSTDPSTKLVHFKKFEKWNWIVCAGIFIDDIDAILKNKEQLIQHTLLNQIKLFSFAELLVLIISISISHRFFKTKLVKPIEALTQVAQEMVDGNFKTEINIESSREINQLVDAMQRMQDSFTIVYERLRVRTIQANSLKLVTEDRNADEITSDRLKKKLQTHSR